MRFRVVSYCLAAERQGKTDEEISQALTTMRLTAKDINMFISALPTTAQHAKNYFENDIVQGLIMAIVGAILFACSYAETIAISGYAFGAMAILTGVLRCTSGIIYKGKFNKIVEIIQEQRETLSRDGTGNFDQHVS